MSIIRSGNYRNHNVLLSDLHEAFLSHSSWEVLTWLPAISRGQNRILSLTNVDGSDGLSSWETQGIFASDGKETPPTSTHRKTSCFAGQDGFASMEQSVAFPTSSWRGIDEGNGILDVSFLASYRGSGNGRLNVRFFDEQGNALHSAITEPTPQEDVAEKWYLRRDAFPVPQEARSMLLRIHFFREGLPPWGFFVRAIRALITFPERPQAFLRVRNRDWNFGLEIKKNKTKKELLLSLSSEHADGEEYSFTKMPFSSNFTGDFVVSDGHCFMAFDLGARGLCSAYAGGLRPIVPWTVSPLYLGSSERVNREITGSCVRPTKGYVWTGKGWNNNLSIWPWEEEESGIFSAMSVAQTDAIPLFPATVLVEQDGLKRVIGQLRDLFSVPVESRTAFSLRSTDSDPTQEEHQFFPEKGTTGFVIPKSS